MPIRSATHVNLVQECAGCGALHTIAFDRGAQKTRSEPFCLPAGSTLELLVDGQKRVEIKFSASDFASIAAATTGELVARLAREAAGIVVRDDAGGVLLESATAGP